MSYITIKIRKQDQERDYLLFYAEYLNEAWLAIINHDDTTKIIRQFKCKEFEDCFDEAAELINRLGAVVKLTANEAGEMYLTKLQNAIYDKKNSCTPFHNGSLNMAATTQHLRNWLAHSFPGLHIAQ